MFLCFFNLLPIPPLDGSRVVQSVIGMSHATFARLAPYGFILVILVIQIPQVRQVLAVSTVGSVRLMAAVTGLEKSSSRP
jgi:Zn-dependent protease